MSKVSSLLSTVGTLFTGPDFPDPPPPPPPQEPPAEIPDITPVDAAKQRQQVARKRGTGFRGTVLGGGMSNLGIG